MRVSQPSFQSLFTEMKTNDIVLASGTSFVVAGPMGKFFLLTARHNLTGRHYETNEPLCKRTGGIPDTLVVWHNAKAELGHFIPVSLPLLHDDRPRWIEHPTLGPQADIAAIPLFATDAVALYPYKAEHLIHMEIEPAQPVSVVGFPFGERSGRSFAVWATGFVASEPEIDHGGRAVFLIDCRTRKGQSGSPVIRYKNGGGIFTHKGGAEVVSPVCKLLGLYSGRINEDSDLGVVWKTWAIAELLEHASLLADAA